MQPLQQTPAASPIGQLAVCADVGGTFTDCLVTWTDHAGAQNTGSIKVLSTGLVRCSVAGSADSATIQIKIPDELIGGQFGGQPSRRLPDDFFRTAKF